MQPATVAAADSVRRWKRAPRQDWEEVVVEVPVERITYVEVPVERAPGARRSPAEPLHSGGEPGRYSRRVVDAGRGGRKDGERGGQHLGRGGWKERGARGEPRGLRLCGRWREYCNGDGGDARVVVVGGGRAADLEQSVAASKNIRILRTPVDDGADQGRKLFPETGGHTCGQIDGISCGDGAFSAARNLLRPGQVDRRKECRA